MITASVMKGLTEHKLEHSFLDTFNPICNCGFDIETLNRFFLHCSRFANERQNPLHEIESIVPDILKKQSQYYINTSLWRSELFSGINTHILDLFICLFIHLFGIDSHIIFQLFLLFIYAKI